VNTNLVADIPLTKMSISPERLVYHLSRSRLLFKYLRSTIIAETLAVWESSPEFGSIRAGLNIDDKNCQVDLLELYKQAEFDRLVRSRFLACKSQLDRVLFSVIQVRDLQLAQELYCRVKEENQSFTSIATSYSDSPAARRGGVIGPISALQLHPSLQHHLIGLKPKQLSSIFQLDEHYIFLQLDRSLPVQLTPQIERQLRDELFEEWLQQQILDRLNPVSTDRISNIHLPILLPVKQCTAVSIASNRDPNSEPTGMLCPTASIFFPQISPSGDILPPHVAIGHQPNSSLFFSQEPSPQILLPRHRRYLLVEQIVAFFVLFWLFLAGGIFAVRLFSQPVITTQQK
jgi:PPIC-type PPIASE domain